MKKLILLFVFFLTTPVFSQSYQLLPDSCTFCAYYYTMGGAQLYSNAYHLDPNQDTVVLGNTYMKIIGGGGWYNSPFGVRQVGNKMFGAVEDSTNEFLIMDFDAQIGDTITNLYSEGIYYDAVVENFDSTLVNGGVYHKWMKLYGIRSNHGAGWGPDYWTFAWQERALCNTGIDNSDQYGGVLFNYHANDLIIELLYAFPRYCTGDTLYDNPNGYMCSNCILTTNSLDEHDADIIHIYPNPVESILNIEIDGFNGQLNYKLCRTDGTVVQEKVLNYAGSTSIDMLNESSGIYFLYIELVDKTLIKKIVKH